ncbi:MAG: hypothetical protein KJ927_18725 [Candidatus Eisenbacteria bacterium]|nr:hypothetical protein [Candidatus Eisenbacteria bacterium]MBU1950755.1 hypothetical protein [Candidatus Eisenbacteria bacterium]
MTQFSGARWFRILGISVFILGIFLVIAAVEAEEPQIHFPTRGGLVRTDQPDTTQLIKLYNRMIARNLNHPDALRGAVIDSVMNEILGLPVGDRIGAWADFFWRWGKADYRFGLDSLGYASQGLLVDDRHTDCVLFFYRTSELGRSSTALEAVQFGFGTRFYGAPIAEVVGEGGALDYNHPAHLDYTVDMIRSGIWGEDVTASIGMAMADLAGTSRFPAGTVQYLPTNSINYDAIQNGDGIHFVLNEATERGRKIRESGALIGHIGVVVRDGGEVMLIHPASTGLEGLYDGGKIVRVPLKTYLQRVDTFKGIIVTRVKMF